MIQRMDVNLVFLASKIMQESYFRLGQNCIKIFSDKSNSVAMFLQIQTDIYVPI